MITKLRQRDARGTRTTQPSEIIFFSFNAERNSVELKWSTIETKPFFPIIKNKNFVNLLKVNENMATDFRKKKIVGAT